MRLEVLLHIRLSDLTYELCALTAAMDLDDDDDDDDINNN